MKIMQIIVTLLLIKSISFGNSVFKDTKLLIDLNINPNTIIGMSGLFIPDGTVFGNNFIDNEKQKHLIMHRETNNEIIF
jgi:hypothetical protein